MSIEEEFQQYKNNQTDEENKNFVEGLELICKMALTGNRIIKFRDGTIYEVITDILETA